MSSGVEPSGARIGNTGLRVLRCVGCRLWEADFAEGTGRWGIDGASQVGMMADVVEGGLAFGLGVFV